MADEHLLRLAHAVTAHYAAEAIPETVVEYSGKVSAVQRQYLRYIHKLEIPVQVGLFLRHPTGHLVAIRGQSFEEQAFVSEGNRHCRSAAVLPEALPPGVRPSRPACDGRNPPCRDCRGRVLCRGCSRRNTVP